MMNDPLKIYITEETITDGERDLIVRLLDQGWDYVHLRHPSASLRDMRSLIESIPQRYHNRLRLHGHFELASQFNIGGLHLNNRCRKAPDFYTGPVSRSCHSIDEVKESADCDYVTLSPIFDSISKPGYRAAFTANELQQLNEISKPLVIALGGITPERLEQLNPYNFGGYAVKGGITLFI